MLDKENIQIKNINNSSIHHIGHNKTVNRGLKASSVVFIIFVLVLVLLYTLGFIDENFLQKIKPIYEFFTK